MYRTYLYPVSFDFIMLDIPVEKGRGLFFAGKKWYLVVLIDLYFIYCDLLLSIRQQVIY